MMALLPEPFPPMKLLNPALNVRLKRLVRSGSTLPAAPRSCRRALRVENGLCGPHRPARPAEAPLSMLADLDPAVVRAQATPIVTFVVAVAMMARRRVPHSSTSP